MKLGPQKKKKRKKVKLRDEARVTEEESEAQR